ncbi:hypothetical protein P5775_25665 [Bacillus cereus]|uniref:hypothetical protein n=1 Tax=Bacillus cereus group TaxID=86661 RepID=UPI0011A0E6FC|nr:MULTISPECIES: hypothetical protein [Bacillus cereus group]MDF9626093.1 hypothetical protein [Bacillus cereus]
MENRNVQIAIVIVFTLACLLSVVMWVQNKNLRNTSEKEKRKLTAEITMLKQNNKELEKRIEILKENTQDKAQGIAKSFIEALLKYDSNQKQNPNMDKIKKMVTDKAEQKLFESPQDAHDKAQVPGLHVITNAEVTDMYYTKTADNKADVTVKYDYIVDTNGTVQREKHTMKLNLLLQDDKEWLVEDYTFQINSGTEGP